MCPVNTGSGVRIPVTFLLRLRLLAAQVIILCCSCKYFFGGPRDSLLSTKSSLSSFIRVCSRVNVLQNKFISLSILRTYPKTGPIQGVIYISNPSSELQAYLPMSKTVVWDAECFLQGSMKSHLVGSPRHFNEPSSRFDSEQHSRLLIMLRPIIDVERSRA